MKSSLSIRSIVVGLLVALFASSFSALAAETNQIALLVVAHGARDPAWGERVIEAIEQLKWNGPKEVAFLNGKPPKHALPIVAARLDQPGVRQIVIVPLLISSFSGHYEEVRFYAGQRKEMPGHPGGSNEHGEAAPLKTKASLSLTSAMDGHPVLSRILIDQVKPLVKNAANESLVLVAHGPNENAENERWLEHLRSHAKRLQEHYGFRRLAALTLRDDAPAEVRDAATEQLRSTVKTGAADSRVLVLPVLVSVGHLQMEIRERLKGTEYTMAEGGVANHPLITEWVRQQAERSSGGAAAVADISQQRP